MIISESSIVAIIVSIVGSVGLICAALLPLLFRTAKHTTQIRDQVVNDHANVNMRLESDLRHEQIIRLLGAHEKTLRSRGRQLARIEERLGIVEDTVPTIRKRKS